MKNKIIVLFLCSLVIPLHFSFALGEFDIGGKYNPIYIQVKPDTNQQWNDAWNKIDSMQYVAACSEKYNLVKELAQKNGFGNLADPFTQTKAANDLNYLYSSYQLCVNNAAQKQNQYVLPQQQKTPTVNILDQVCQQSSGLNSYYSGETDVSKGGGMSGCSCKSGFQFKNGNYGECVIAPVKSNNEICKDKYGLNSTWGGTLNDKGGLVCDCNKGYQWSIFNTRCDLIPVKKITSISSGGGGGQTATLKTPKVVKTPEVNVIKEEIKEVTPVVAKVETVTKEANTIPITNEVRHKGLWAKIKGWLGF